MDKSELELKKLFNIDELIRLLQSLAEVLNVSIGMVNYKGDPLFDIINPCEFCSAINANSLGKKRCLKSLALGGLEAMRQNKPLIACCHAGLSIGVIPIMVDEFYVGALSVGEVLIYGKSSDDRNNGILGERSRLEPGENEELRLFLRELYNRINVMEEQHFIHIVDAIWNLLRYIVGRMVELKNEKQTYEWVLQNALTPLLDSQSIPSSMLSEKKPEEELPVAPGNPLYPALKYLQQHPDEAVTMRQMAELCHLSHSYFSKLFFREIGENFSDYVCRKKIELAKTKLRESGESVMSIASSLGFSDSSYFIKVFRKLEGITPLSYRQHRYLKK